MTQNNEYGKDCTRLAIDNPQLTRAVTAYLELDLTNSSSIVIDGYMIMFGLNITGFDGMRADLLVCLARKKPVEV